jgi:hypothetical protein
MPGLMRLKTHLMLTLAGCALLVFALGLPWFGSAPTGGDYIDGPMDRTLETIGRAVSAHDGISGRAVLGSWATVLTVLAVLTAAMAALCMVRAAFGAARAGLRLAALAMAGLLAWKLIDHPDEEFRRGAVMAAATMVVLLPAALAAAAEQRRPRSGPRFGHPGVHVPPPPPPRWESTGSAPPPGF